MTYPTWCDNMLNMDQLEADFLDRLTSAGLTPATRLCLRFHGDGPDGLGSEGNPLVIDITPMIKINAFDADTKRLWTATAAKDFRHGAALGMQAWLGVVREHGTICHPAKPDAVVIPSRIELDIQ